MLGAIELIETKGACCETTPRYKVMLNGVQVEELWYNMRGYVGYLPAPSSTSPKGYEWLDIGEKNITAYRKQVKKLNKEWRMANDSHKTHSVVSTDSSQSSTRSSTMG